MAADRLAGQVAVLAGVEAAAGPSVAAALAGQGLALALLSGVPAAVEAAVAATEAHPVPLLPFTADRDDPEAVARLVAQAEQRLGPVDLLVELLPASRLRAALLPAMRARRHGGLIRVLGPLDRPLPPCGRPVLDLPPGRPGPTAAAVAAAATRLLHSEYPPEPEPRPERSPEPRPERSPE